MNLSSKLISTDEKINYLSSQFSSANNIINITKKETKTKIETFSWNPKQLEELLNNWYYLGITTLRNFDEEKRKMNKFSYELEKYEHIILKKDKNEMKVYFDLIQDEDWNIKQIFICSWDNKQEVYESIHPKIFKHFTQKVVKYKENNRNYI